MFYARIRKIGSKPGTIIIGSYSNDKETLESIWPFIQRNLEGYLKPWQIPSCPPYLQALDLLKHITPKDDDYICTAETGAVFCWRFFSAENTPGGSTPYLLEVWDSETDYALGEEYHQRSEE